MRSDPHRGSWPRTVRDERIQVRRVALVSTPVYSAVHFCTTRVSATQVMEVE